MASIFILLGMCIVITNGESTPLCVFDDSAGSTQTLDLRPLMKFETLEQTDDLTPPNIYQFTPCKNGIDLPLCAPDIAMAVKLQSSPAEQCIVMANWDTTAQATLPNYDDTLKRWTFEYHFNSTGNDCNGAPYTFFAYFNCAKDVTDFIVVSAGTPRRCTAEMFISTRYACPRTISTTAIPQNNDESMSGGSIFLIIVLVALSAYFLIGYIFCAIANIKRHGLFDFNANIPHRAFWNALPSLVIAGCIFSRDFVSELCGNNSGNRDHLIRREDDDYKENPFAKR